MRKKKITNDMRIALIDDESFWTEKVKEIIEKYFGDNPPKIDSFCSGEELLEANEEYNILFVDIEMQGLDGFETIKEYTYTYPEAVAILLTTHTEMSRKGYYIDAFRFIDKEEIEEEIPEALHAYEILKEKEECINFTVVNWGEMKVRIKDIITIMTSRRNIEIHTKKMDYLCNSQNMHELEDILRDKGFYRTHKSYIVNLNEVKQFDVCEVIMRDDTVAYLSRRKYGEFKRALLAERMRMGNG